MHFITSTQKQIFVFCFCGRFIWRVPLSGVTECWHSEVPRTVVTPRQHGHANSLHQSHLASEFRVSYIVIHTGSSPRKGDWRHAVAPQVVRVYIRSTNSGLLYARSTLTRETPHSIHCARIMPRMNRSVFVRRDAVFAVSRSPCTLRHTLCRRTYGRKALCKYVRIFHWSMNIVSTLKTESNNCIMMPLRSTS